MCNNFARVQVVVQLALTRCDVPGTTQPATALETEADAGAARSKRFPNAMAVMEIGILVRCCVVVSHSVSFYADCVLQASTRILANTCRSAELGSNKIISNILVGWPPHRGRVAVIA